MVLMQLTRRARSLRVPGAAHVQQVRIFLSTSSAPPMNKRTSLLKQYSKRAGVFSLGVLGVFFLFVLAYSVSGDRPRRQSLTGRIWC